jgi:hypothetical protein
LAGQNKTLREIRADFDRRTDATREIPTSLPTPKLYIIPDPNVAKELSLKSAVLIRLSSETLSGSRASLVFLRRG